MSDRSCASSIWGALPVVSVVIGRSVARRASVATSYARCPIRVAPAWAERARADYLEHREAPEVVGDLDLAEQRLDKAFTAADEEVPYLYLLAGHIALARGTTALTT